MNFQNANMLAETLKRSGLACSVTEAARMAQSIMCTEKKVSSDFDAKRIIVDKALDRKKSNKTEVEELIEKTDFMKKDFYVPIAGYNRAASVGALKAVNEIIASASVQAEVASPVLMQLVCVKEDTLISSPAVAFEPFVSDSPTLSDNRPLTEVATSVEEVKSSSAQLINESTLDVNPSDVKVVFLDDNKQTFQESTAVSASREKEVESSDDFIIKLEDKKIEEVKVEAAPQPEKVVKKQDLPKVDIMQHFYFGKK
ncbi:MAG: hypothetical protein V1859_09795 [archaeon]